MTATEQSLQAKAPEAAQAVAEAEKTNQPGASRTLPAPSAPVPPTAAAKTSAKRVVKTPAKKVTETVKTAAAGAVKPVVKPVVKPAVKSVARKAPAVTKPVATTASTKTATKKTVTNPVAKTAGSVAPRLTTRTPVKAEPRVVIAAPAKLKVDKLLKAKKPKLVRDSFSIPKLEYLILEELKRRSSILGNSTKKSELIRAGIKALAAMVDANFLAALKAVPAIKTGRPVKD